MNSRGSIYARNGSPYWWYEFQDTVTGKRRSGSTGVPRHGSNGGKKAARDFLDTLRGDAKRGISPDADKVTLHDLERLVLAALERNGRKSAENVERAYRHLRDHFAAVPARRVPPLLDEYIAERRRTVTATDGTVTKRGAAAATVRQELRWLGRGLRLAAEKGLLPYRPTLPAIEVNNARQGFVTTEQLEALVAALPDYMRAPTRWGFATGWRKGEVFGLTWARVDLENA